MDFPLGAMRMFIRHVQVPDLSCCQLQSSLLSYKQIKAFSKCIQKLTEDSCEFSTTARNTIQ